MNLASIGRKLFKIRGYMGVPLFLLAIVFANRGHSMPALGLISVIIGEMIRMWSVSYSGFTTRARDIMASKLVTEGPYSVTRNPIYIGNFLVGLGIVLISGALYPYLLIAYPILFWIEYIPIIHAEEEFLASRFGNEFELYRRNVPRVLPDFRKFRMGNQEKLNLKETLHSERSTIFIVLATLLCIFLRFIF